MRVGVQANRHRIRDILGNVRIRYAGIENSFIDARKKILLEPANGIRRPLNRLYDSLHVIANQRAIPLLNFYNSILNGHGRTIRKSRVQSPESLANMRKLRKYEQDGWGKAPYYPGLVFLLFPFRFPS